MGCIGEVAEWSKAAVLKTVEGQLSQGSNPCLSAKFGGNKNDKGSHRRRSSTRKR